MKKLKNIMIEAGLVILACSLGKGCIETSTQYYNTNPELRQIADNTRELSYKYLGQFTVEYTLPFMLLSLKQNATIKVTKNLAYTLNNNNSLLTYKREF